MTPKKAAKKAAKKAPAKHAAKKAPAKHAPHKPGKDARRAFEHLGRIGALAPLASSEQEAIALLVSAADKAYRAEYYKESADLLRAAEHLSFAGTVESPQAGRLSEELLAAIREEFDHLRERSEEHGEAADAPSVIRAIYTRMTKEADSALKSGSFRKALELVRGAEALTHLHHLDERLLGAGKPLKGLQGSR